MGSTVAEIPLQPKSKKAEKLAAARKAAQLEKNRLEILAERQARDLAASAVHVAQVVKTDDTPLGRALAAGKIWRGSECNGRCKKNKNCAACYLQLPVAPPTYEQASKPVSDVQRRLAYAVANPSSSLVEASGVHTPGPSAPPQKPAVLRTSACSLGDRTHAGNIAAFGHCPACPSTGSAIRTKMPQSLRSQAAVAAPLRAAAVACDGGCRGKNCDACYLRQHYARLAAVPLAEKACVASPVPLAVPARLTVPCLQLAKRSPATPLEPQKEPSAPALQALGFAKQCLATVIVDLKLSLARQSPATAGVDFKEPAAPASQALEFAKQSSALPGVDLKEPSVPALQASEFARECSTPTLQASVSADTLQASVSANTLQALESAHSTATVVGSDSFCVRAMTRGRGRGRGTQRARARYRGSQRVVGAGRSHMSDCARTYLHVLENPFSGQVSCVPTLTNFPTMKHSVRCSGAFQTGGVGVGYVCISPFVGPWNSELYASYSEAGYTGNGVANAADGLHMGHQETNTPYDGALNKVQMNARLVACGLRVRNVTPLMYRGGALVGVESLGHQSLAGSTITDILMQDTAERLDATSGEWASVVYHPMDDDEYDFFGAQQIVGQWLNPILCFLVAAAPVANVSQTFEWESYCVFEAKGNVVHGLTPSRSDPAGLAAVQNSTASVAMRKPTQKSRSTVVNKLMNAAGAILADTVSYVLPNVVEHFARPTYRERRGQRPQLRLANASAGRVAFPAVGDHGVVYLYTVRFANEPSSDGTTSNGHSVKGYVGVLKMHTTGPLVIERVEPTDYGEGKITTIAGPKVTDQSLQLAVAKLMSGTAHEFGVYTGLSDGSQVGALEAKRRFADFHRLQLYTN